MQMRVHRNPRSREREQQPLELRINKILMNQSPIFDPLLEKSVFQSLLKP